MISPPSRLLILIFTLSVASMADGALASPLSRRAEAAAAYRAQDWKKTIELGEPLSRENPYDGAITHRLSVAYLFTKRYEDAIAAARRSNETGFALETNHYNIACALAQLGRKAEALDALEQAIRHRFDNEEQLRTDHDLDPIRGEPRFKAIIGGSPEGLSRDERWRFDLDHLARRMEQVHFNLYAKVSCERFQQELESIKQRVPQLKDHQIPVLIQRLIALAGDGHTRLLSAGAHDGHGNGGMRRFPVSYYLFKDGLFVRGAGEELKSAVGGRVLRIGKADVESAMQAVRPLSSIDNAIGERAEIPFNLTLPPVLETLGLIDDLEACELLVEQPDQQQVSVTMKPRIVSWDFQPKGFVWANAAATAPLPEYLRDPENRFRFVYDSEHRLVYCQINAILDQPGRTFEQCCANLFALIGRKSAGYLVLDLRLNGGGNNTLMWPLIHGVIRCEAINQQGRLFVITGRRTFSAAMNTCSELARHTKAIFVGEPPASSPNFVGEVTPITLPFSGVRISCSSLYWQNAMPNDTRFWIAPQLLAELTSDDFRNNRDPALEAIHAEIRESAPPATGFANPHP